ncbi:hypothetical protein [Euhalothece natronophila]|nr:hypothetical protein [Euhalothece natronophila]
MRVRSVGRKRDRALESQLAKMIKKYKNYSLQAVTNLLTEEI